MRRHAYRWWCLLAALGAAACGSAEPAAHGGSAEAGHGTMAGHSEAAGVSGSSGADARAGAAGTAGKISAGAGGDVHGGEAGAATHAANGGGASAAMQLGGSGGMAGASAKLQCPSAAPSAGDACQGIGSCTYGERPGCRSVWDCLAGKFALLAGGQCVAAADDRCPMAAPASGSRAQPLPKRRAPSARQAV
jgi:hypothetical protein